MKLTPKPATDKNAYQHLSADKLRQLLLAKEEEQRQQESQFKVRLKQQDTLIHLLEEQLRLAQVQRFTAKSEKLAFQIDLFDEAELEAALDALDHQLSTAEEASDKPLTKKRQRGFSPTLKRERVELLLPEADKAGASHTFFTKTKEELDYIPAQMVVLEYWQEKAVFATAEGTESDRIITAPRPTHPLGKCHASVSLLTQIITHKYVDGLPLYRQENLFKRFDATINRSSYGPLDHSLR